MRTATDLFINYRVLQIQDHDSSGLPTERSHTTSSHGNRDTWKKQNHLTSDLILELQSYQHELNARLPKHISGAN